MYCGVVTCFVILLCSVGYTAAKCDPEKCGSMEVSYPFWIKVSDCGFPGFQIYCFRDEDTGTMAPFLRAESGADPSSLTPTYYKILNIDPMGYLTINSTSLKARPCSNTTTSEVFQLPRDGPFYISMLNRFVVFGCNTVGSYAYGKWGEAKCISTCYPPDPQINPPYCRYGCCEITLPDNWKWINFRGGGTFKIDDLEICGYSTIFYPSTFKVRGNKTDLVWMDLRKADYGLLLNWGVSLQNCAMARNTANYSCSSNAECIKSPSRGGHVCRCLPGYEGNGYSNGTDCTDINECINNKNNTCVEAKKGGICHNLPGSYNCSCAKGYEGDGNYTGTGCTDIDECGPRKRCKCVGEEEGGICHNSPGSYSCSCAKGYKGDGFRNGTRCKPVKTDKTAMFAAIGDCARHPTIFSAVWYKNICCFIVKYNKFCWMHVGSVSASVGVFLGVCVLLWWLRKHYQKHASEGNFRRNGGELLERILQRGAKQTEGEEFRIFNEKDLKDATRNFSEDKKLGGGRSSTVYEGLLSDNTSVAIKKFKEFPIGIKGNESRDQFINEIHILAGLDNQNVVKLIGCCLHTRSPILVYEFVRGGTVSQKLRSLCWQSRLQIAMGSAGALAYLHSDLVRPIFHRDVKSSNILLGHHDVPKVANFGLSWMMCENDAHLKTNVMETSGYMDPEYFRTGTFTDKSDVYSFGVVLAELLTGREPLSTRTDIPHEEMVLSECFLSYPLTRILDPNLKNEGNQDQMNAMASLARECLSPKASERPSMKEVKMKLEEIGGSKTLGTSTACSNVISNKFQV